MEFKTLNMITIEEKDAQIKQFKQMVIERDEINYLLEEKIEKLEKQARKSICESCVSMTNQAHNQDCIIEELEERLKQSQNQATYYLNLLESTKKDLAMTQRFIKGFGQAHVYSEVFRKEAI
jgi:predicted RNase H-like nuclease (RuvC/YqgF family)